MIRLVVFSFILFYFIPLLADSQDSDREIIGVLVPTEQHESQNRLLLSKSRGTYPVTPGDVYKVTYRYTGKEISIDVLVESDYSLDLNVFGKLNADNMTFPELKKKIEETISSAYPNSIPFTEIKSIGLFQVLIKGELARTQFVNAWGLTRLSEVISNKLSPYTSIRQVGILSRKGYLRKYDFYKALHQGIVEEDPFVRPGDTIILYRREKAIEVIGEVYKPGKFQILQYENLRDVLENYCGGFTQLADKSRIRIERVSGERPNSFSVNLINKAKKTISLEDNDTIIVPSKSERLPVVFFEGALTSTDAKEGTADTEMGTTVQGAYSSIVYTFKSGDTLYDALVSIRDSISPSADMKNSYLFRESDGEPVPVDLENLFYKYRSDDDIALRPLDRIVIPHHRFFVTVVGAVKNPGNILYYPEKRYDYYVGVAGGIPSGMDSENITIFDKNGNRRSLEEGIQPEDMVVVAESFVSVTGAVTNPGRYQFTPGKSYTYYVDMAGGIDTERNTDNKVEITDGQGNPRGRDDIIQPNDRIFVQMNDFIYNFNRYFPVITTGALFVTTIVTIINLLAK